MLAFLFCQGGGGTEMPPHLILGYSISEWVGIITIGVTMVAAIKTVLVKPLTDQMTQLSSAIKELNESSNKAHTDLANKINKDHMEIEKHDIEIGFLYDKNNLKRRNKSNED